jgi:hypothetical protein
MLLPVAVLFGCEDVGLPGRNTPEEEHANRVWRYDVYDEGVKPAGTAEAMVHFPAPAGTQAGAQAGEMGRHYLPAGETMRIPQRLLRPVAGMGGTQLYALATDNAPYDRLFAAASQRPLHQGGAQAFHMMLRVPERGMSHGADSEEHGTMDHGTGH